MSPTEYSPSRAAFQHVVNTLAGKDGFMAQLLRVALSGDVSAARIAREFSCSEDAALRLAMMRSPAAERDKFRRDVARMADDIGIDAVLLSATIRQARALSAFQMPSAANMLMAARDNIGDEEDR